MKKPEYAGLWRIHEADCLDGDYLNMEVQAYIRIDKNKTGEFQLGLLSGSIDGRIVTHPPGERFEFTWEGCDECDPASGCGWMQARDKTNAEGEIKIHMGDNLKFHAKKTKK